LRARFSRAARRAQAARRKRKILPERGSAVKETFRLWKAIFTKPEEGYKQIAPETRLGLPMLFICVVLIAAGLLLIPVVTSDAYREASVRATLNYMDKASLLSDPGARKNAADALSSPLQHSIQLMNAVAGPVVSFFLALVSASGVLWLAGFALKSRIKFGVAMRVFAFTWAVFAWATLLQSVVLLLSDYEGMFARITTLAAFRYALSVPFSLSILFPPGSASPAVVLAVDFVTNLFNIIFYVLLFIGVRVQSEKPERWKAGAATGAVAFLHFLMVVVPAFFI
jgi:hypothetical protein